TASLPPAVESFAAGPVSTEGASLNGQVNPENLPTTYWFEWGTADCADHACRSVPAGQDASAGSDALDHFLTTQISGLAPEAGYHSRLLAKNAAGTVATPDRQFTTTGLEAAGCPNEGLRAEQHAAYLPDCRAYELVSPTEKDGAEIMADSGRTRA